MGLNVYVSEVYEQLNGMTAALYRTIDKLSDYLSSVDDFVNDTVLKGVSYDSMKTYFGEVHAPWAKGMIAACEAMIEANNSYINAFVEMVDASGTDIIEEDLRYMMMKLSHSINNFQAINQAAGEEVVDTWHLEQLEAEHQRLLERLYDFDYSTADYYNYAQSLIEAAKQGGSLMGNSWDASTSTFLNPAMLNMEWRPLVDSAWKKLSEGYILFRGKYVHARRKLEQYWNRQDGYFEGFWWQDAEKMKEAYWMLDLEIAQKGGIKIHDLITSEYAEDQLKMYALQSLSNAPRTGTYDLEFLHSLENMYLKAGLDYSETDHTIDKKGLEALKECYKNIKLKKSGDWLERGGGDIIAGVTLIAGGMVVSRVGNRSLKIRSEGIGNTGSGKTYSVKRGPKLQGKSVLNKGVGRADFADKAKLESHFNKHGEEFKGLYKNADEYLQGAREVMKNGSKIQYNYKGEVREGYVKFMGNTLKGKAKFEFVGTNNEGFITTYHTESGKTFWKLLNGGNIPVINPID
jgi:hypothetical protein